MSSTTVDLRAKEYDARQEVWRLRRTAFEQGDLSQLAALSAAEAKLQQLSNERAMTEKTEGVDNGQVIAPAKGSNQLGPKTTGLDVAIDLRMACVPTSLVHLFNLPDRPLVSFRITNTKETIRRLRLISWVEGFSAKAVDTVEVPEQNPVTCHQLPTFFPDAIRRVTELTRATLNVEVQDLDARTELHKTIPIWLLARTTMPLQIKDPSTGKLTDNSDYLGAYVTPNAPEVMKCVRDAAGKHPGGELVGYQDPSNNPKGPDTEAIVTPQVRAVYDSLAASGVVYVNSVINFTPEAGSANQRVRLPSESLANRQANCIDGALLMASMLEAISLNPAIVLIPGHAFLAWETWGNNGDWSYVETTLIGKKPFDEARTMAQEIAKKWRTAGPMSQAQFRPYPVRELRAKGITPME